MRGTQGGGDVFGQIWFHTPLGGVASETLNLRKGMARTHLKTPFKLGKRLFIYYAQKRLGRFASLTF